MKVLVDTNVLLRAIDVDSPFCESARNALKILHRQGHELCLTSQNIREFWNVSARPTDKNGFGISVPGAERHIRRLERHLTVIPDSPLTYARWRELTSRHGVMGAKVHDAWLVAAMQTIGIQKILTFNSADFARYDEIGAVDPGTL